MPDEALMAALIIRSGLISSSSGKSHRIDTRIAIGLGTVDRLGKEQERGTERLSGTQGKDLTA